MTTKALSGRTAIVTGGGSGIGLSICKLFLQEGANVAVLDRAGTLSDDAEKTLSDTGAAYLFVRTDVTDSKAIDNAIMATVDRFGDPTILVNCAGTDELALIEDVDEAHWNREISVHLTGTFLMAKAVLPFMRKQMWGRIINLSSQLAHRGCAMMTPYCAAKAGVMGFTKALAYEVASQGITANTINPGPIDTPLFASLSDEVAKGIVSQIPLGRMGKVEEVAHVALLLAREEGGYFLGASMNVNGGHYML